MNPDAIVTEYLSAWERGDADAAYAFYADDIVMHLPGRSSVAGDHEGKAAVVGCISAMLARNDHGSTEVQLLDCVAGADRVFIMVREKATRGAKTLDITRVDTYRVVDGKIAEILVFEGDQYAVDDFFP
jgi:ketosteroid isomerase-like protein